MMTMRQLFPETEMDLRFRTSDCAGIVVETETCPKPSFSHFQAENAEAVLFPKSTRKPEKFPPSQIVLESSSQFILKTGLSWAVDGKGVKEKLPFSC